MKFERESWRKLYVAESAEHRLLPIFVRGLRDYLLRLAGEDGTILSSTDQPKKDLRKLLGAEGREQALVNSGFDDLVRIGYLSFDGGRLWITRFEDAQAARSQGAIRQARFKENKRQRLSSPETLPDALPVTLPSDAPVALQIDETRRDETTTTGSGNGPEIPCPANLALTKAQVATLETSMVPAWGIDAITKQFVAKYQADPADCRTIVVWRKCLAMAVSSNWNNPSRRPKPADIADGKVAFELPKGVKFGAEGL